MTLIEFVTYRRKGHAEHDNQSYQPREQIAEWEKNDPVDRYSKQLTVSGWASAPVLAQIDQRVLSELDQAVALCENEPQPDVSTTLEGVYADPAVMETEWYRRLDGAGAGAAREEAPSPWVAR